MRGTKEKAQELVDKFKIKVNLIYTEDSIPALINAPMTMESAKQCALICVNELLTFREALFINEGSMAYLYLKEVKEEIEKL
jgi:hypothetical protein